jgi:squalene-associated FAD-dependent desaturase
VKVAVIGGGFAGLAAAIALQEEGGHDVTVLERRGVLGGRATSFRDALSGEDVDNGTHLMIGAYRETLDLVRRAGASDLLLVQERLRIDYRDDLGWSALDCPRLPAPLHLLAGLAGLRMPWRARLDAVRLGLAARFGRPPAGLTLTAWFDRLGQGTDVRRLLWAPLATAILNETPDRAAAVLFYNVYRAAFLESADASRLVFLRRGYAHLLDRLGAYLEERGGRVLRRARAEAIEIASGAVSGVAYAQRPTERRDIVRGVQAHAARIAADAVVSAVPWSALPPLLPRAWRGHQAFAAAARLTGSPIVSIEMWLDRVVVDRVMAGLRDCEVEWVFDKGRLYGREGPPQHLAFIISAAYRSTPRPNAELTALAEAALRRYFPSMAGARVTRTLVLREPDATFSCDPDSEAIRPGPATPIRGLVLAGDWTATGLPATIEGAVRSGHAAARRLLA